jgi:hypothetical protein
MILGFHTSWHELLVVRLLRYRIDALMLLKVRNLHYVKHDQARFVVWVVPRAKYQAVEIPAFVPERRPSVVVSLAATNIPR